MGDGELKQIIEDPLVKIYIILYNREIAGYIEIDHRAQHEIEIAYFGILPKYHGLRLGSYLLNWGIP